METRFSTRRQFVARTAIAGSLLAAGCGPGQRSQWEFLDEREGRILAAICDQIIPADDYPSASQAGVLRYIDRQLSRHFRGHRDAYRSGLRKANELSRARWGTDMDAVRPHEQLAVVSALEQQNRTFFNMVLDHTMQGYYGSPRHGGNRDAVSWRMLGLDEPPVRGRAQYDVTRDSRP